MMMMQKDEAIAQAMADMGWNMDADIPMANEENVRLLKELESLMEEKTTLEEQEQHSNERIEKMSQHSKNAEVSINHNLKLLHAYQSEVRTENHQLKLSEREHSKLKEDIKNLKKEYDTLLKFQENTEKEVCKRRYRIDNMTNRIKWAKTAMIEWTQAMADGKKGYDLIEKYFKEDQLKAKEQEFLRQKVNHDVEAKRKELVLLYDEQKALEQGLECTANLYRVAHAERRQMVETWKAAVTQMAQRESDIRNGDSDLIQLKDMSKKKAAEQKRHDNKLDEIICNNREVEAAIEELNSDTSEIKEQIQRLTDMVALKENEVEILQKELQGLSNRVQQQRAENRQNNKQKEAKLQELNNTIALLDQLDQRYASMESKTMSAQQRLQVLEDMNDDEQKTMAQLTKDINRTNGLIFRAQQQLVKTKSDEKVLRISNEGTRVTRQAVQKNNVNAEKELRRQTELHYELGFKCLQIERNVIKLEGGILDPEVEQRNQDYLEQLEEQQVKIMKRLQSTEAQNKKLDDNMRTLTTCYNADFSEMDNVNYKIKESQVYCEGGIKQLKAETQTNQLLMVELSILKMRTHEFEQEILKCTENSYNLEKHRAHLNRTMKDRMVEIKSQRDLLMLKRKHLCEERSTLKADIGERNTRIDAVKGRFELTSKLLGTNEDGSIVTATQLKVEMAQEKQMLLDEGNVLNAKVLKAEEEIQAMENTLLVMNNSNDAYRKHFQHHDSADETTAEVKTLQLSYCKALTYLKTLRNKIHDLDQANEKAERKREELEKTLQIKIGKKAENEELLSKLHKEISEQKAKLQRAERDIKQALKTIKQSAISEEFMELFNKELELREIEDRNTSVTRQLYDLAESDDNVGPEIVRTLNAKGIKMPQLLMTCRSISSKRSDTSELSYATSKEYARSMTSRSSTSAGSQALEQSSSRVSVVTLDFPGKN